MESRTYHKYIAGDLGIFWRIIVNGPYIVRQWGTIGSSRRQECGRSFQLTKTAQAFAARAVAQKLEAGYILKSAEGLAVERPTEKKVTPKVVIVESWEDIESELLAGEKVVYNLADQNKLTLPRRKALVAGYQAILYEKSEQANRVREAVWKLLRLANLTYLLRVATFKPDIKEVVRATIAELVQEMHSVSRPTKGLIESKFEGILGSMSAESVIEKIEADLKLTTEALVKEIKVKENISIGGISRKRAKRIARLLKKEKKNED